MKYSKFWLWLIFGLLLGLGLLFLGITFADPPPPPPPPPSGGEGTGAPLGIAEGLLFSLVGYGAYKIKGKGK